MNPRLALSLPVVGASPLAADQRKQWRRQVAPPRAGCPGPRSRRFLTDRAQLSTGHCNFAAPLQSHWPADLRDGPWLQPELLLLGLYLIPISDDAARVPAGAGRWEQRQEMSFFNWYTFAVSLGGFVGLVLVVWLENRRGWDIGFTLFALYVLLGMLIWMVGFPFYRNQLPDGSAITRILQVLVVAFKKRNVQLPDNASELKQLNQDGSHGARRTQGRGTTTAAKHWESNADISFGMMIRTLHL